MNKHLALIALGKTRSYQAVGFLIQYLAGPSNYAKHYAAWALGNIGNKKAVEPLCAYFQLNEEGRVMASRTTY